MLVSVPATSANLGPGFDTLGVAINLRNQVKIIPSKFHSVSLKGEGSANPKLKDNNIFARRYFYPLISNMPTYKSLPSSRRGNLPQANLLADKVICLPIYPDLSIKNIEFICNLLK